MTKEPASHTHEHAPELQPTLVSAPSSDGGLPLVAMILGVVSLAMFMLFLGIPALILGLVGLRKYPASQALNVTAIITGSLSTMIMLGLIALVILGVVAGAFATPSEDPGAMCREPRSTSQDLKNWQGI